MTENNTTQTSIYSLALTEAKYLVNSGKLNPEPAKHLIHLRHQLRVKLRESCSLDRFDPRLEEDCKTALVELQKAIKEVTPDDWNLHTEQMELYKKIRGEDYQRTVDNICKGGEMVHEAFRLDQITQEDIDKHKDVDGKVKSNGK